MTSVPTVSAAVIRQPILTWDEASTGRVSCSVTAYSPPGSSVHGILQARILEWVAIPFSRGSSQPGH